MSFHQHSANVRCLSPEQVVHLHYYANSLFEDDVERSSNKLLCSHHDPNYIRNTESSLARENANRTKNRRRTKRASSITEPNKTHLPVLSSAEGPYSGYYLESWASEFDRIVHDLCCAMVDRHHPDPALTVDPMESDNELPQIVEQSPSRKSRRRRRHKVYHC